EVATTAAGVDREVAVHLRVHDELLAFKSEGRRDGGDGAGGPDDGGIVKARVIPAAPVGGVGPVGVGPGAGPRPSAANSDAGPVGAGVAGGRDRGGGAVDGIGGVDGGVDAVLCGGQR